jgi:ABC-type arginine transport system permease subunit
METQVDRSVITRSSELSCKAQCPVTYIYSLTELLLLLILFYFLEQLVTNLQILYAKGKAIPLQTRTDL